MNPIPYDGHALLALLKTHKRLSQHAESILNLYLQGWQQAAQHGDFPRWLAAYHNLICHTPLPHSVHVDLNQSAIHLQSTLATTQANPPLDLAEIEADLRGLQPWRKGPFDFFGVYVDCEWRSDLKWDRLVPHITSLTGRNVLDMGCGSGYHIWRMMAQNPRMVLGIDPGVLFGLQFQAVRHYFNHPQAFYIPARDSDLPPLQGIDTVFSMGVLYHRKSPIDHLQQLRDLLRPGGELVLETLVVEGDVHHCFMPEDRYAKMRNVWFIPSVAMLSLWLHRAGFVDIRCVDINQTTMEEQRMTDWMNFESLEAFLDPDNMLQTIEGHPAPTRAIMIANRAS
ncbi:MAG: tRNA 5-methoxyuridine(34)/uridine 5-oxyacetic acid(34) synthase CmoB [Zetaproteobacteria bacterium]|nr:tRNA 5-methoxyuridine(34)/uridine 5-oxyacetic acid(34) synthase CmoB [Zetaproteobacteria bacterium]